MRKNTVRAIAAVAKKKVLHFEEPLEHEPELMLVAQHGVATINVDQVMELSEFLQERLDCTIRLASGGYGCFFLNYVLDLIDGVEDEAEAERKLRELRVFVKSREFIAAMRAAGFDNHQLSKALVRRSTGRTRRVVEPKIRREVDVLALTALPDPEYRILTEQFEQAAEDVKDRSFDGIPFRSMRLTIDDGHDVSIASTFLGMGVVRAAAMTARILEIWAPRSIILVGIAGGIDSDVTLGDVILADQVFYYSGNMKITDSDTRFSPSGFQTDRRWFLAGSALSVDSKALQSWKTAVQLDSPDESFVPRVVCGTVASGNAVVDSRAFKETLKALQRKILAVEMESAGLMEAVTLFSQQPAVAIIRGISDMAEQKSDTDWRQTACRAAASFAMELLTRVHRVDGAAAHG